jgi:hypothetical protein
MKQIIGNLVKALFVSAIYLALRAAVSFMSEVPNREWGTLALLLAVATFLVFVISYLMNQDKAVFSSVLFFFFFVAGYLFWKPEKSDEFLYYSVIASVGLFFFFSLFLLFERIKAIKKGEENTYASAGQFLWSCMVYVIILPAVALGEMIFQNF